MTLLRYGVIRKIVDCIFANIYAILPSISYYFNKTYNKAYLLCILEE